MSELLEPLDRRRRQLVDDPGGELALELRAS